MASAMARASGPEMRTMPMPPRPGGVDTAAIVSWSFTYASDNRALAMIAARTAWTTA